MGVLRFAPARSSPPPRFKALTRPSSFARARRHPRLRLVPADYSRGGQSPQDPRYRACDGPEARRLELHPSASGRQISVAGAHDLTAQHWPPGTMACDHCDSAGGPIHRARAGNVRCRLRAKKQLRADRVEESRYQISSRILYYYYEFFFFIWGTMP